METDTLNHLLGRYVTFAFNDPKHYPKKPFTNESEQTGQKMTSDEALEAHIRAAIKRKE